MLSIEDVVTIHARITKDAQRSERPVTEVRGSGVSAIKDRGLLESAVARQHAGDQAALYYPTVELNAATLMYGLEKTTPLLTGTSERRSFPC